MSVAQMNSIDSIGIEKTTGVVILSIIDDLDWSEEDQHLFRLQEKLNMYMAFIESGEIFERYPTSEDKPFKILVYLKHEPPANAIKFLDSVISIMRDAGLELSYKVIRSLQSL